MTLLKLHHLMRRHSLAGFIRTIARWFFGFSWLRGGEGIDITTEADGASIAVDIPHLLNRVEEQDRANPTDNFRAELDTGTLTLTVGLDRPTIKDRITIHHLGTTTVLLPGTVEPPGEDPFQDDETLSVDGWTQDPPVETYVYYLLQRDTGGIWSATLTAADALPTAPDEPYALVGHITTEGQWVQNLEHNPVYTEPEAAVPFAAHYRDGHIQVAAGTVHTPDGSSTVGASIFALEDEFGFPVTTDVWIQVEVKDDADHDDYTVDLSLHNGTYPGYQSWSNPAWGEPPNVLTLAIKVGELDQGVWTQHHTGDVHLFGIHTGLRALPGYTHFWAQLLWHQNNTLRWDTVAQVLTSLTDHDDNGQLIYNDGTDIAWVDEAQKTAELMEAYARNVTQGFTRIKSDNFDFPQALGWREGDHDGFGFAGDIRRYPLHMLLADLYNHDEAEWQILYSDPAAADAGFGDTYPYTMQWGSISDVLEQIQGYDAGATEQTLLSQNGSIRWVTTTA